MIENIRGLLPDGMIPDPLKFGQIGGEEPFRAAAEKEGNEESEDLPRLPSLGAPYPEDPQTKQHYTHPPGWEELFADFPRPADRRAQEFLKQWLRRLGRG